MLEEMDLWPVWGLNQCEQDPEDLCGCGDPVETTGSADQVEAQALSLQPPTLQWKLAVAPNEYAMLLERFPATQTASQVLELLLDQHQFSYKTLIELEPDELGALSEQLVAGIDIKQASRLREACEQRYWKNSEETKLSPPKRQKLDETKDVGEEPGGNLVDGSFQEESLVDDSFQEESLVEGSFQEESLVEGSFQGSVSDTESDGECCGSRPGPDISVGSRVEVLFEGNWCKGAVAGPAAGGEWNVQCDEDPDGVITSAAISCLRVERQLKADLNQSSEDSEDGSRSSSFSDCSDSDGDCNQFDEAPWSRVCSQFDDAQWSQVCSQFKQLSTQHADDKAILTGPATTHTTAAAKEQITQSVATADSLAQNGLPPPLFPPPPRLIKHPGGSKSANDIIHKAVWPVHQLEATMEKLGVPLPEILKWRALAHVDVDRLISARFTVLVVDVEDRCSHQKVTRRDYASKIPSVSSLLDSEHMLVSRSTLLVWQVDSCGQYEAIALFASQTPDLNHYWGGSATGDTGRARTLQMVSKMRMYCNTANRGKKDARGQMWGEGLRKARFQRKDHNLGRDGLGYYRHKGKTSWRQDECYTSALAENVLEVSVIEASFTPMLSEARRLVTKAVLPIKTWDKMLGAELAERSTALTFYASLDYACKLHVDASACGFPESIVFVKGEKDHTSWHFSVPCAGVVFDLAAASPSFLVLQASDTVHGTLHSNLDHHANVGMALVTKANLATPKVKSVLAKARLAKSND